MTTPPLDLSGVAKSLKGVGAVAAITLFTLGANWYRDQNTKVDLAEKYVTRVAFVTDSIAAGAKLDVLFTILTSIRTEQTINATRLKEICDAVQAGCR